MNETLSEKRVYDIFSASFWERLIAWIIDQILLGGIVAVLTIIFLEESLTLAEITQNHFEEIIQIVILANLSYFTALEGAFNQTLGKRVLNILVCEENGKKTSFTSALIRRIGLVIPIFSIIDGGIILVTSKNQRIFDIIAGTLVLKKDHLSEGIKFLKGEDITEDLVKKGTLRKKRSQKGDKDQKTLKGLREMESKIDERFENEKIDEDEYRQLKRKYEKRIAELEENLRKRES